MKLFLELMKKFSNKRVWKFRKRGRGGGEHRTYHGDTPIKHAKWFAVYYDSRRW